MLNHHKTQQIQTNVSLFHIFLESIFSHRFTSTLQKTGIPDDQAYMLKQKV